MQKRSHWLLADALLRSRQGFSAKRFDWAFLLGSCQPDCNPFSYLKGSLRAQPLQGHNFSNSQAYLNRRIARLRQCNHWTLWHYYTLGKLTHYLADAFTYPHNPHFPASLRAHRCYERCLRTYLQQHLAQHPIPSRPVRQDPADTLHRLHRQYIRLPSHPARDTVFILRATTLLMSACPPPSAHFSQPAQNRANSAF